MDILIGNGRSMPEEDFSSDWNLAPSWAKLKLRMIFD
jgi:hypothetical protein